MVSKDQRRRELAREKLVRQQERREADARRRRLSAIIAAGVAVLVVIGGIVYLSVRGDGTPSAGDDPGTVPSETTPADGDDGDGDGDEPEEPVADGCTYIPDDDPASDATAPPDGDVTITGSTATITFPEGDVVIELAGDRTPCTVQSFVSLAQQGYFDGTDCHRLTTSATLAVLQCGDPSATGSGGPGYSFADETRRNMTYERGTVAMANAGADTNGSQFFLVHGDSDLQPNYTVFGQITSGLEVLDEIAERGTESGATDGAPAETVTIGTVTVDGSGS